jgi:hypothetical protein
MRISKEAVKSITAVEAVKHGGQDGFFIRVREKGGADHILRSGRLTLPQASAIIDTYRRDLARHGETNLGAE